MKKEMPECPRKLVQQSGGIETEAIILKKRGCRAPIMLFLQMLDLESLNFLIQPSFSS